MLKKLLQLQSTHDLKLDLSSEFLTKYHNSNNEFVETTMNEMKSNVEHLKSSESSVTASLFWLSVFHWEVLLKTFNNGSEKDYFLHCEHCQMSHYLKKAIRGRLLTTEEPLNPAAMHRWWCPCVHHNKLLTDYEQINEDEESKFYSKSLIKRQLNELPGWSQMLDSLKQDSKISNQHAGIGLALLNHEHLPNEYDASLLVKNILQNSLSSIFVSENERRQWLRKQYENPNETREGKVAVLASKQDANDLQPSLETVVPRVEHPTAPEATSSTSGSNKEDSEPSPTTMTTVSPVQTPTTVEAPTTDQPPHVHTSSDVTRSTSHESLVIKDPMSFSINLAPRTPTTQLESSFISPFSTTTNYQEMGTASLTRADKEGIQSPLSGPHATGIYFSNNSNFFTAQTLEEPYTLSPPMVATSPALDLSTNDSEITNHQTFTADDMLETRETMIEEDQQLPMHETTAEASSGLLTPVKADTFIQLEPSTSHTTPSIASVSSPVPSNTLAVTTPTSTTARKAEISTTTPSKPPSSISSSSKTTSSSSSSSSNTTPNKLTSTPKDSSHSSGSTSTPNKSRKQQSTRQSSNKKQSTPNSDNTATLSNTPSSKQFRQSGSNKQGNNKSIIMGPTLLPPAQYSQRQKHHQQKAPSTIIISNDFHNMIIPSQTRQEHHSQSPSSKEPVVLTNSKAIELLFGNTNSGSNQHVQGSIPPSLPLSQQHLTKGTNHQLSHHHEPSTAKHSLALIDGVNSSNLGGSQHAPLVEHHHQHATTTYSASSTPLPATSSVLLDSQDNTTLHHDGSQQQIAHTISTSYKYGNFRDRPNDFYPPPSNELHSHYGSTMSSLKTTSIHNNYVTSTTTNSSGHSHSNNNSPSSQRTNPFHQQEKHQRNPLASNPPPYHFHTHASTQQGSGGSDAQLGWRVGGSVTGFGGGGVQRASPTTNSMMMMQGTSTTANAGTIYGVDDERMHYEKHLREKEREESMQMHHQQYDSNREHHPSSHARHYHDGFMLSKMESSKYLNLSNMEGHTFDGNLAQHSASSYHPTECYYQMNHHEYSRNMPSSSSVAASTLHHHQEPHYYDHYAPNHALQPSLKKTKIMSHQERKEFMHDDHHLQHEHILVKQIMKNM
ncbi:hypothetical protein C9374_002929 [Naegleria lovaniensis]|uniref:Uncharacterized protein n=1 Tax=Naegleria lovaniensis TaxID=51637 RepID=A0AA88KJM0_NAELO|nr:uncharacterized protein C9374_002929 [Naegleria lovaniensis]KAG2385780.1 hypothetical protein C9374_002929 [Naegleria lovaniensis]